MRMTILAVAVLTISACGAPQPANDSTAVLSVDTLKAAVADSSSADSVGVAGSAAPGMKSTGTKSTTGTATKADSLKLSPNIGHDSVIRRPPGRMPAMDTGVKRP